MVREAQGDAGKSFLKEGQIVLKRHWLLLTYMVLLMAGFNFMVSPSVSSTQESF